MSPKRQPLPPFIRILWDVVVPPEWGLLVVPHIGDSREIAPNPVGEAGDEVVVLAILPDATNACSPAGNRQVPDTTQLLLQLRDTPQFDASPMAYTASVAVRSARRRVVNLNLPSDSRSLHDVSKLFGYDTNCNYRILVVTCLLIKAARTVGEYRQRCYAVIKYYVATIRLF